MAKGYKCPECNASTATYEKGAYQCQNQNCQAVWWSPFDRPSAGTQRKGYTCVTCDKKTIHPVAEVADATIWRCSTCGTTIVVRT